MKEPDKSQNPLVQALRQRLTTKPYPDKECRDNEGQRESCSRRHEIGRTHIGIVIPRNIGIRIESQVRLRLDIVLRWSRGTTSV